jgi:hypothetical protein
VSPGERPVGRAEGKVLSASLFGRHIDFGTSLAVSQWRDGRPAVAAEGVGTSALAEQTRSAAQVDGPGAGGRRCATPPPGMLAVPAAGPAVPALDVGAACGEASAAGDAGAFQAAGTGGGASLGIGLPAAVRQAVTMLRSGLDPAVLPLGLGSLLTPGAGDPARTAAQRLDSVLGGLIPGTGIGALLPTQTVGGLLDQLGAGELARVTLGTSTSRAEHDPAGYMSQTVAQGGTIDLLPGLLGGGGGPLARLSVAASDASVRIDQAADHAIARVTDPVVRIQSPVLGQLGLAGLTGVTGVPGLTGATGLTGLVPGLKAADSASGVVELGPGQGVSLLCQGPVSLLCTEIAVAPARGPATTADGRTSVSAATVSIRLFQVPALPLPVAAGGTPSAAGALPDPLALAGLSVGAAAPAGGVEFVLGTAHAEAGRDGGPALAAAPDGAARISAAGLDGRGSSAATADGAGARPSAADGRAAAATLPRTGGLPFNQTLVPLALLGSVGLAAGGRRLLRRA